MLGKKILLVDDDVTHRMMAKQILSDLGCAVMAVDNGFTAIAKLRAQPDAFSLIIMDWEMPEKNGLQTAKEIREYEKEKDWPKTPIIAFTSHKSEGDRETCLNAGMDDYMAKEIFLPKWHNLLKEKLEKWMGT